MSLNINEEIKDIHNYSNFPINKEIYSNKIHLQEYQNQLAEKILFLQAELLALLHNQDILNSYSTLHKSSLFFEENSLNTEAKSITDWNYRKRSLNLKFNDFVAMVKECSHEQKGVLEEALNLLKELSESRNTLISSFLPLLNFIAKSFEGSQALTDLKGEGYLGLIDAIELFYHISTKSSLQSYVGFHIKQHIRRFVLENKVGSIRIPYMEAVKQAQEYKKMLNEEKSSLQVLKKINQYYSFSDIQNGEEDKFFSFKENTFDNIWNKSLKENLNHILNTSLSPKEKNIIVLRFGLNGNEKHTLSDVGKILEISRERVRQLEARALPKLQKEGVKKFFLEDLQDIE